MYNDQIQQNISKEKDSKVVDDLMNQLENLEAKINSNQSRKHDDDEDKKKRKYHRQYSIDFNNKNSLSKKCKKEKLSDEDDEDIELELVAENAPFFKIYDKQNKQDLNPIEIIRNRDGSLQQAAIMQNALLKQRRETLQRSKTSYSNKTNNDINSIHPWKNYLFDNKKLKMNIIEQRQSLPIYNLKQQFLKGVNDNQILIVIGETGSGKTT